MTWVFVATAAVSAVSAVAQGAAQKSAHNANARIAEQNRTMAIQQAAAQELQQRRGARYALGRQAAAQAESGIDTTTGSAARVTDESATSAELDAQNIRYRGIVQGFASEREAAMEKAAGRQAMRSAYTSAALSIAGGVAKGYAAKPAGGGAGAWYKGQESTFGPGSGYGYWEN